jgi:hypothetical protein
LAKQLQRRRYLEIIAKIFVLMQILQILKHNFHFGDVGIQKLNS